MSVAVQEPADLTLPEFYFNRELSLLQFNRRVLELAQDEKVPLLERLKFLCISTSNMDEFFEVRVGGLKQQLLLGISRPGPDGMSPQEQLRRISEQSHELVEQQYTTLNDVLLPELADKGINFVKRSDWTTEQERWVEAFFRREVAPVLSPIGLDPSHPFPKVQNKSLNFVVTLEGEDPFGRESGVAVVQAPRSLARVIRFPEELSEGDYDFVFLSSVIHAHVGELFPGMVIHGCHQFRVTRNSDLFVDEEEVEDLLSALKGELPTRNLGQSVRLEVADDCPEPLADYLLKNFGLEQGDLYMVNGPVNLNRLMAVPGLVDRPELKYVPFSPSLPRQLATEGDVFAAIRQGDILLHHPYQSFTTVIDFVRQAAADPNVLAIKWTLYRTGTQSVLVDALLSAARAGKEVTVVIELRARFDEEANITLADKLHAAGCQVVYGIVGYKTHAKMAMVVRREGGLLRRYVHLGTGNYHAGTARLYTDYGLLTSDPQLSEDVHHVFQALTGPGRVRVMHALLMAPFTLHNRTLELIEREIQHALKGKPARIVARMNSLIEPEVIRALYRASQAGVRVDLIVRGLCSLRPGLEGISENIQVRSILGRFLEHSRVFYFDNDGSPELYCGSADWMPRNFFKRVEICFPVNEPALKERVFEEALDAYLRDNTYTWVLESDGNYRRLAPGDQEPFCAQDYLLEQLAGDSSK
jgi:polyphosphate kinase